MNGNLQDREKLTAYRNRPLVEEVKKNTEIQANNICI